MKTLITNYTFDALLGAITFSDYTAISLDGVLLVTNVTDNVIIYNFASPLKGGTVATNVLSLVFDTSAMDNADSLQIYYDDPDAGGTGFAPVDSANLADIETNTAAIDSVISSVVTLTTLDTPYLVPSSEQADRRTVIMYNKSDTDIFYGDSSVTTDNGILIPAGGKDAVDVESGLYIVCGTDSKEITILEMR